MEILLRNIDQIIISTLSVLAGVIVAFVISYLKEKRAEKEKLKAWKMIAYQELMSHKVMIEAYKKISELEDKNVYYNNGVVFDKTIYDYNLANKVLGKDFNIYSKYIIDIKRFELFIEKYLNARLYGKEDKIAGYSSISVLEHINIDELDLIIEKIGKSLGKDRSKFDEPKPKIEKVV